MTYRPGIPRIEPRSIDPSRHGFAVMRDDLWLAWFPREQEAKDWIRWKTESAWTESVRRTAANMRRMQETGQPSELTEGDR